LRKRNDAERLRSLSGSKEAIARGRNLRVS